MLSTERDIRAERQSFRIALVASALLHLLFLPPALWFFASHLAQPPSVRTPRDVLALSTSIQIEPRVVPNAPTQPHRQTQATQRPAQPLQPQRASAPAPRPEPRPVPRHEIARVVPSAAPQAPGTPQRGGQPTTLSQRLAAEQAAFAREVARLHEQSKPLAMTTAAPSPAAPRHYAMDLNGSQRTEDGNGVVTPIREWEVNGLHCYYGHLAYQVADGGREDEDIPWPFCYPANNDQMAMSPHLIPVPTPVPGYVLPPSSAIGPVLKRVYDIWLSLHH